jgi:Ca2+-binding EF-hand superfamily protein
LCGHSLSSSWSFAADTAATDPANSSTPKVKNPLKSNFSKADTDNDGTVDREEAKALPNNVAAHFDAIDTDKDGTVSRDELKVYNKVVKKDKDADGTLDKAEAKWWWTVSRHFDEIDADKDGTVSVAEINTYMSANKAYSADAKKQSSVDK